MVLLGFVPAVESANILNRVRAIDISDHRKAGEA